MTDAINVGLSIQRALSRALDVTANNIANMSTAGFRRERLAFGETFERLATPGQGLSYADAPSSYTDMNQGALKGTGAPLDVAIEGEGFLRVMTPEGERLTRDGRLALSPEGILKTVTGHDVLDAGGAPIALPPGGVPSIAGDGTISIGGRAVGQLGLAMAAGGLAREADGLFRPLGAVEAAAEARVAQGMIEGSNVDAISEITRLIEIQRGYERISKLMQSEHDREKGAIDRLTRT
ncbi:flagellar basal-body rod protein FlgF [Futiania mangrovi]|uniref:Flagellar basal-body rod protein FlgF n=1 Tax=Futiania mangrovi TaxID=2959716 RepID=A0A9J6PJW5_9PROT|nr:flagellar basal-body rod protein FlgF [Futiania mangrovii]MCP1336831.1 flagellar basal-body rod protein FlgF [Futiania mangrovii]